MVSTSYWNRFSEEEKAEYKEFSARFIKAVMNSDARDGFDFCEKYKVKSKNGLYFLSKEDSEIIFADITSKSRLVIETLQADAGQNYGR